MLRRRSAVALGLAVGLAACATTYTPEEVARAQALNQYNMELMQQSAMTTQANNEVMMMNMGASMIQPVITMPPPPMP